MSIYVLAAILSANLQITVKNLDETGHRVTVEVQRTPGLAPKTESVWIDAGETVSLEKMKGLIQGNKVRVLMNAAGGPHELYVGRIDQVNDKETVVIQAPDNAIETESEAKTQGLAKFLEVEETPASELMSEADLIARLGSLIIAERGNDGQYDVKEIVPLAKINPEPRGDNFKWSSNMVMTRDSLFSLSANAIFASLSMELGRSEFYSISWDISKSWYASHFSVSRALMDADNATLESIYLALIGNPEAEVYIISRYTVIHDMIFTTVGSHRVTGRGDVNVGMFVSADGTHVFDHREENIIRLNGVAVSVIPTLVSRRKFLLAYLESRIGGKYEGLRLHETSWEYFDDRHSFPRSIVKWEDTHFEDAEWAVPDDFQDL